jgi:hypothetical protein
LGFGLALFAGVDLRGEKGEPIPFTIVMGSFAALHWPLNPDDALGIVMRIETARDRAAWRLMHRIAMVKSKTTA